MAGAECCLVIVDCAHYRGGERLNDEPLEIETAAEIAARAEPGEFVWLGLRDPSDDELARAERGFGLNPLAVEDARETHQRPKLEGYDGSVFIVLRTRALRRREGVGRVRRDPSLPCQQLRDRRPPRPGERAEAGPSSGSRSSTLLDHGVGAVAWAVLDKVVDDYTPVVDGIDNDIQEVEQDIFAGGSDSTQRIYFLKREVIEFHRAVAPLLPPLEALERGAFPQIDEELRRYFRDVADHARRVDEQVNSQRELLTSILEANLALLSVKQNEVVRTISAWAAIIAVPDVPRLDLGHELRGHARAPGALGLPARAAADGGRRPGPAPVLQAHQLALTHRGRSVRSRE